VMGSALAMASLMVLAEIAIQNAWLPLPRVHLIHFGLPWVFFAITVRLVQQFAQSLNRSERLAIELEQRVAQKAIEIEASYEQISHLRANQAAQQERQRIAADLHDDLGAKLLSIIHTDSAVGQKEGGPSAARMAREALDEMRLSVRGLTAQTASAQQVLANWRAETIERLDAAGLQADWHADEPHEQLVLGARTQVQLTRILRESVSNTLRHAGAKRCAVRIRFEAESIEIRVEDDGCGLSPDSNLPGHGLINIERRARVLGGTHSFERSELGGASICVRVPLSLDSAPIPLE
jgi:two-component system, NarL family, sensor histidine kinase UhpB